MTSRAQAAKEKKTGWDEAKSEGRSKGGGQLWDVTASFFPFPLRLTSRDGGSSDSHGERMKEVKGR